jgi:hypothetical protein
MRSDLFSSVAKAIAISLTSELQVGLKSGEELEKLAPLKLLFFSIN